MIIELIGWKSKGLRAPDIEVKLERSDSSVACVTLIQMPNGTGKTTTLNCLRAAMDGSAESWDAEKVKSFGNTDTPPEFGSFIATLRINHSKRIVIEMTFHFVEGVVTYRTTAGSKIEDNYCPPPEVRRYLDPRFSELLFFDGELANDLISGEKETNAGHVIDTFYGLYHLADLKRKALDSFQDHVRQAGPAKGAAQSARLIGRIDRFRSKLAELEEQTATSVEQKKRLEEESRRIDSAIETHLLQSTQFQEAEQIARDRKELAKTRVEKAFHEIDKIFPNPLILHPFLTKSLGELADNLDKLKLPEFTSRAFFDELINEPDCVCDRPMNEAARAAVKRKADLILGDSINGFLNSLKRTVRTCTDYSGNTEFAKAVQELVSADDDLSQSQSALDDIRAQAAAAGDEEISRQRRKLEEIKGRLEIIDAFLEEATRPTRTGDDEQCKCVDFFKKRVKAMDVELARLSGTLDRKHRTDCLISVIDDAYNRSHLVLKGEVISRANEQLAQILKYNPVEIEDIGRCVKLRNRGGASMGQNLSVGYVFLAGLLHGGGNQFPLVVDSPVGALDDIARRNLGQLLPKLVKQMVAFVIPSERQWFADPLAESSGGDVLFLTHLRINEHTKDIIQRLGGRAACTSESGIVLEGKEPFFALGEDVNE